MRAAIVENGVVINVIEVESLDVFPNLIDGEAAQIGGTWDGSVFTPATISKDQHNAPILAALAAIDAKTIRPLREGDTARVAALDAEAASLRAQLIKD